MKRVFKCFSPLVLVLLIFGIMILGVSMKDGELFRLMKPARSYGDVLENGIKEGDHVKGEICYSLGMFASQSTYTQYEDHRTGSKTAGYYYVIPVGEKGLMAVYVRKDDQALMEQITDETYDYLEGGELPQTTIRFNGVAEKMDTNLKGLEKAFKNQLKEWEYTDAEIDAMLADTDGTFLVLDGPADVTTVYAFCAVGIVMIGLAVFFFIRKYKKEKALEAKREEEWTKV